MAPIKYELTLNLLTSTIVALSSNASKWQMRFNSAFKGLNIKILRNTGQYHNCLMLNLVVHIVSTEL